MTGRVTNRLKLVLFAVLVSLLGPGLISCKKEPERLRPRLVVVLVIDQFRFDFLEKFNSSFGSDGFRRLIDHGAFFANANYNYVPTYTAPGHAAIFTGSAPAYNGIVGNSWYDRESGQEKVMVSDDRASLVTSYGVESGTRTTKPASPRSLIGTTIGDQMRLSNGFRSKVVAMSIKDRAAVLPGGKDANGAYFFDASSGSFVSSDYYFKELPRWVDKFNSQLGPDRFFGKSWDRALGPESYATTQAVTTVVGGSPLGRHLPYKIDGGAASPGEDFYKAFLYTPFASEYLADFAKAAIDGESLGADEYPDLLAISFSTPDLVGHAYGPDSEEVQDTYIRLDAVIADFLSYVDQKVGLSHTVIAMTGDHGVSPVPQLMSLNKFDAQTIDPEKCKEAVNSALSVRFGPGKWVLDIVNEQVYLDRNLMNQLKADPAEAERITGEALLALPGIARYFTRTQIINGQMSDGPIARRVANGFNPQRSGDVWLITRPFTFLSEGGAATTHGSPYDYDTHVPVIFFGAGIRHGRFYSDCSPTDIAPSLAALLHVEPPPNVVGRVLSECILPEN